MVHKVAVTADISFDMVQVTLQGDPNTYRIAIKFVTSDSD